MKKLMLAALVIGVSLAGAAAAQAQPAPWEPERLTPGWTFTPALGFGGLWDSNSTLRVTGDPLLRQWVGVVNPRGEFDYNGRRNRFALGYSGSLEAYKTLTELTRYDQRGRMMLRRQATPRLMLSAQSSLSVSPTTDRLELGNLPFENIGSTLLESSGGAEYALGRQTTMATEYEFQAIAFDRKSAASTLLRGGHSHSGMATLRHTLTSRLSTGAAYTYRFAKTDGGLQNIAVQDAIGLVRYQLAEHTTFDGGLGMARLQVLATGETQVGPSMRASLSQGLSRSRVELAYQRSFIPSWSFGGTTTNEELRASVHVPFAAGRFYVQGSTAFRHNEPLLSRDDRITLDSWSVGGTVGYGISRWLRVEGFYSGSFQKSSARGEINRERIGIQFVTLKPVRIQ